MQYAEIIADHKAAISVLTYQVPAELLAFLARGSVVTVPYGRQTVHGVVVGFKKRVTSELAAKLKPITSLVFEGNFVPSYIVESVFELNRCYGYPLGEMMFSLVMPMPKRRQRPITNRPGVAKTFFKQLIIAPPLARLRDYSELIKRCLAEDKSVLVVVSSEASASLIAVGLQVLGEVELIKAITPSEQKKLFTMNLVGGKARIVIGTRGLAIMPLLHFGLVIIDEPWWPAMKEDNSPYPWIGITLEALCRQSQTPLCLGMSVDWPETALLGQFRTRLVTRTLNKLTFMPGRQLEETLTEFLAETEDQTKRGIIIRAEKIGMIQKEAVLAWLGMHPHTKVEVLRPSEILSFDEYDAVLALGFDALLSIVDFRISTYLISLMVTITNQAKQTYWATRDPDKWSDLIRSSIQDFENRQLQARRSDQLPPYSLAVSVKSNKEAALEKLLDYDGKDILKISPIHQIDNAFERSILLRVGHRVPEKWYKISEIKVDIMPHYIT